MNPPTFNSNVFNSNAFMDTSETLTLGMANNLYLPKNNPIVNTNMFINGNLGISNSSPTYNLDVTGNARVTRLLIKDSVDTASTRLFSALDNSQGNNESRYICFGKANSTNNQAEISFYVNADGSATNFLAFGLYGGNTMYITGNQRVGIGTSNPQYMLQLVNDSASKPATSTWTISSDIRIKEDIQDADLNICYNNIKNLKLKYYKWKDQFIENHLIEDKHRLGWIAQEVEPIIPKAIETINNEQYDIDDFKSLNQDQIYANLYGAVQKLIIEFEQLKDFVNNLEFE